MDVGLVEVLGAACVLGAREGGLSGFKEVRVSVEVTFII